MSSIERITSTPTSERVEYVTADVYVGLGAGLSNDNRIILHVGADRLDLTDIRSDLLRAIAKRSACVGESSATFDVLAERENQRAKWGEEHDDEHKDGAIGAAGAMLAWPDGYWFYDPADADKCCIPAPGFAYDLLKKHEHDRRKQLVIAASLLLAEIERIDRSAK